MTIQEAAMITTQEVRAYTDTAKKVAELKRQLSDLEEVMKYHSKNLIEKVESGLSSPEGFAISIDVTLRRSPSWKEEFGSLAANFGLDPKIEQERVTESTPAKEYKKLVVLEI
jgi:hypothetical protein